MIIESANEMFVVLNYSNGCKYAEGSLQSSKRVGKWVEYYSNNIISAIGYYKDDLETGKWIEYHRNGNLWQMGNYKNGNRMVFGNIIMMMGFYM
jgi:antitoxin component YwqK of YwqJK toxin-antitoxin module